MSENIESQKLLFERQKHARERWWYEETLIHQRLTWFFSAQGLLGLGYAWLRYRIVEVQASPGAIVKPALYVIQLEKLAMFLLALGVIVSAATGVGVHAAARAQDVLKSDPEHVGFKLDVSSSTTTEGMLLAYAMPVISMLAWAASLLILR